MPPLSLSLECYAGTFASIGWHFEHQTLERCLPSLWAKDQGMAVSARGRIPASVVAQYHAATEGR